MWLCRLTNYIAENPGDGTANPDQGNDGDDDTTPPASTETLANGEPATVENVLAMLDEIKEKYPQGTPWTVANSYYSPAFGTNSTGCAAYAYTVSDLILGTCLYGSTPTILLSNREMSWRLRIPVDRPSIGLLSHRK